MTGKLSREVEFLIVLFGMKVTVSWQTVSRVIMSLLSYRVFVRDGSIWRRHSQQLKSRAKDQALDRKEDYLRGRILTSSMSLSSCNETAGKTG